MKLTGLDTYRAINLCEKCDLLLLGQYFYFATNKIHINVKKSQLYLL